MTIAPVRDWAAARRLRHGGRNWFTRDAWPLAMAAGGLRAAVILVLVG